jgi:NAD(P) transhydrogenase subunit alpha
VPKETAAGERRVALVPRSCAARARPSTRSSSRPARASSRPRPTTRTRPPAATIGDPWRAEIVVKVAPPSDEEAGEAPAGQTLVSFLNPLGNPDGLDQAQGHRAGDGDDPAHQPRAVDGRALQPGDRSRLPAVLIAADELAASSRCS